MHHLVSIGLAAVCASVCFSISAASLRGVAYHRAAECSPFYISGVIQYHASEAVYEVYTCYRGSGSHAVVKVLPISRSVQ